MYQLILSCLIKKYIFKFTLHNLISHFVCRSMCLSVRQLRARVKDKHWECHLTWLSNNMFLLPSKSMIIILIFLRIYILWDRVDTITQLLILLFSWCSKKKSSNWLTHRSSFILISHEHYQYLLHSFIVRIRFDISIFHAQTPILYIFRYAFLDIFL